MGNGLMAPNYRKAAEYALATLGFFGLGIVVYPVLALPAIVTTIGFCIYAMPPGLEELP